jgi:hypothetical protein
VYLLDWNLQCLRWINEKLQAAQEFKLTEEYVPYPADPHIIDCRNLVIPNKDHGDAGSIRYTQVFEDRFGFRPNLSILDILFCAGPKKAISLLKN